MRFEVEKVENETINAIYGDVYTIKDNFDEKSPINESFRLLKPSADKICDWLNGNVKPITVEMEIKSLVKSLWKDDEIVLEKCGAVYSITEIKPTNIIASMLEERLDSRYLVKSKPLSISRSVFYIKVIE